MADQRVAVQRDGGRVRVRTIVKGSRGGGQRKRRKVRIEWREPKVVSVSEWDAPGRMKRGSRPVIDGTLRGPAAWIELGADRLAASLSFSCCFRELDGDLAPDLNDLATLKLLVPLLLAPLHEVLPVTIDLDAP
jgi:hypothetical protein